MTAPGIRVLAGRLLVSHGMSEAAAETILRSFTAAELDIVKRPTPAEPQTGPKAEDDSPAKRAALEQARAAIRGAHYTEEQG